MPSERPAVESSLLFFVRECSCARQEPRSLASWLAGLFLENINAFHDLVYQMTGLRLFPPNVYYLERIPMVLRWQDVLLVSLPTLIFGFFGSILPAIGQAADPIEAFTRG